MVSAFAKNSPYSRHFQAVQLHEPLINFSSLKKSVENVDEDKWITGFHLQVTQCQTKEKKEKNVHRLKLITQLEVLCVRVCGLSLRCKRASGRKWLRPLDERCPLWCRLMHMKWGHILVVKKKPLGPGCHAGGVGGGAIGVVRGHLHFGRFVRGSWQEGRKEDVH